MNDIVLPSPPSSTPSSSTWGSTSPTLGDMIVAQARPAPPPAPAPEPAPVIPTNPTEAAARLTEFEDQSRMGRQISEGQRPPGEGMAGAAGHGGAGSR